MNEILTLLIHFLLFILMVLFQKKKCLCCWRDQQAKAKNSDRESELILTGFLGYNIMHPGAWYQYVALIPRGRGAGA